MPGRPLSDAPRLGLFGKLPAHGDFVRRGDPVLVELLDRWLSDTVVEMAQEQGELDERLEQLPTWCFHHADGLSGALIASRDRVGRLHPLVAAGDDIAAEAVAAALIEARNEVRDADALFATLSMAEAVGDELVAWWRSDAPESLVELSDFPSGAALADLSPSDGRE